MLDDILGVGPNMNHLSFISNLKEEKLIDKAVIAFSLRFKNITRVELALYMTIGGYNDQ